MNNIIKISIVILTKNQENMIEETLKAVFCQEISCGFEVIIIDSGSNSRVLEIIRKYPVVLIQISPEEFGHGKTRNLGMCLSKGEYLVFLNGDATPKDKHWLNNLIRPFLIYEDVAGVCSRLCPRQDCNPLGVLDILRNDRIFSERIKHIKTFAEYKNKDVEEKRRFISFHTISCAIKKDLLLKNPFADIEFGEDLEWSQRMLEKGYKIIFESSSEVIHSHDLHKSFIGTMKRYFDDARLNHLLLKRWTFSALLKLPLIFIFKSIKDMIYISHLKRNLSYKLSWILYSPIIRMAELLGIFLGASLYLPAIFTKKMSLVEEIKHKDS
ncbi:MAG: hypothetical protein A2047_00340 [Omnitrophica bacterium GWA2_41_15]|nr:MAG: hypothetical protein A2047_00340 [Omnitrophica bacterium GWA2_41_15]HAZ10975.1 hypothetical protein [Candidatus Omnitrophota bacterium]